MKKVLILLGVLSLAAAFVMAQDSAKVEKVAGEVQKVKETAKVDTAKAATEMHADSAKAAGSMKKAKGAMDQKKMAAKKMTDDKPEWITTPSGLKYRDIKVGTGDPVAQGNTAAVHYTGWLWENGKKGMKFDSSRDGKPPYPVRNVGHAQVIAGWNEGLIGMKQGGQRELLIPPALGYGSQGFPGAIPPNSTLFFEVEVMNVTK